MLAFFAGESARIRRFCGRPIGSVVTVDTGLQMTPSPPPGDSGRYPAVAENDQQLSSGDLVEGAT
jgi:hypothetical protein